MTELEKPSSENLSGETARQRAERENSEFNRPRENDPDRRDAFWIYGVINGTLESELPDGSGTLVVDFDRHVRYIKPC